MRLETHPITARSFEKDYFIDGDAFERAYKLSISGFSDWPEALHAEDCGNKAFNDIAAAMFDREDEILNYLYIVQQMLQQNRLMLKLSNSERN